jgi:hypothetical protein
MPFDDSLKGMQTPERLYALCRLVHISPLSREQLGRQFQPAHLNKSGDQLKETLSLAEKGALLAHDPQTGLYRSQLADEHLRNSEAFRTELTRRIFSSPSSVFTRFTCWFLNRGASVLGEKSDALSQLFFQEVTLQRNQERREYNDTNITAWKAWAAYFGLGYLHGETLVPNAAGRIHDLLRNGANLPVNRAIPFKMFMEWLAGRAPELDGGSANRLYNRVFADQRLSYALSSGLRTLHDIGTLRLSYTADAADVWYLTTNPAHAVKDRVSEIEILVEG